jgi:ribosomal protein S27AE
MVTGSRNWTDRERIKAALVDLVELTFAGEHTLIHGACPVRETCPSCGASGTIMRGANDPGRYTCLSCHGTGKVGGGADWIADEIARGWGWTVETYPPSWGRYDGSGEAVVLSYEDKYFAKACLARNKAMAESKPDICLAFPLPGSNGTWHAIRCAADAGVEARIYPGREG